MIILDPIFIHRSENGLYAERAEENLSELKRLMKDIILKETDSANRGYSWGSDGVSIEKPKADNQTQTDATGGRLWAKKTFGPKAKKVAVKTFSL